MDQLYTDTLKELEQARAARDEYRNHLEVICEMTGEGSDIGAAHEAVNALLNQRDLYRAAEEMQIALREKMERQRDELAADRADLIKELTACQNMLHGLARSGGCSPDYPNDAKKVLERVTGGHAPDFEDSGPKGKSLSRRDALNQVEALEKLAHELASDLPEKCARKQILAAFRLRIGTLRRQAESQ